ncbi:glycoside hydrolase [Halteromyces radiatus]|uniref:glycoside hydrolase n=1 Tax=Halteromyces radiatus TaxID=101107 RepID=UPI00221EB611|nr:glycoside hydrolase [Halteromyces radiatus]KAI8089834.1 glycoside hydrolase [Halteromyces radiatus]
MKTSHIGLYPHLINPDTGHPVGDYITWGGMADSFYEYIIKQYVFSNGQDTQKKEMAIQAVQGLQKFLLQSPKDYDDIAFLANINNGIMTPLMDELACFAPSVLLLSARWIEELADVEQDAAKLLRGCYRAWASTRTGIAPEVFGWIDKNGNSGINLTERQSQLSQQFGVFPVYPSYILRPETLESLFYFYQTTGDKRYQDMAWDIFNSLHTYCLANSGFSGIDNVDAFSPKWDDRQESFLFAETFKYLYLIWDEPLIGSRFPLDQWVFNTEAHPLRIITRSNPTPFYSRAWHWLKDQFHSIFTIARNTFMFFI